MTEPKPVPGDDIVTDPKASALYNSRLEGWGDRIHAAGVRLCKFFKTTGAPVQCEGN